MGIVSRARVAGPARIRRRIVWIGGNANSFLCAGIKVSWRNCFSCWNWYSGMKNNWNWRKTRIASRGSPAWWRCVARNCELYLELELAWWARLDLERARMYLLQELRWLIDLEWNAILCCNRCANYWLVCLLVMKFAETSCIVQVSGFSRYKNWVEEMDPLYVSFGNSGARRPSVNRWCNRSVLRLSLAR